MVICAINIQKVIAILILLSNIFIHTLVLMIFFQKFFLLQLALIKDTPPLMDIQVDDQQRSAQHVNIPMETPKGVLRHVFGYTDFRSGQEDAINALLKGNDTIVVIPTGGGKTVVYAIPSIMKRGLSVVVSPLVMLMYDQVARLRQLGINTCYYNTLLSEEEKTFVLHNLVQAQCQYEFVFVSPEAILKDNFMNCLAKVAEANNLAFLLWMKLTVLAHGGNIFAKSMLNLASLSKSFLFPLLH